MTEVGMLGCQPGKTLTVANHGLRMVDGAKMSNRRQYQRLVGKLIYLSHTIIDISYVVGLVHKLMHLPQVEHLKVVVSILRYLKRTSSRGLYLKRSNPLDL